MSGYNILGQVILIFVGVIATLTLPTAPSLWLWGALVLAIFLMVIPDEKET